MNNYYDQSKDDDKWIHKSESRPPQNIHTQIEQGLRNGKYGLKEESGTYLLDNEKRVVCFLDGKITPQKNTLNNISFAQQLFRGLSPRLQQLAQMTVKIKNNTQSMINPAAKAASGEIQRAHTPSTSKTTGLPRPTQTHITQLTNDHCKSLQMHIERGEVFFNDDLKALTSLDERFYFSPNNDGGFSTRPARAQLTGYDDIKSQYLRWEKAPVASAQTSRSKPSFTAKQPQQAYSTTPANKGKLATLNSTWTSEQPHRNTERRPTPEAVVGSRPSSSKAVVKAMSPMPKMTAGQTEAAKREQQQPVVIRHYFSGYKGSYDSFKKEHKELCDFMRTRDVLGKANYPDHCKSIFEHRGFFEHHLYQMFMVETSRAALSPLMARFRSADNLQTKTDIAIEIAEQCIQRSNDTSSHLLANKDSYYEACDSTKTNKEDSPLTVAVADTSAAQFFKEAVRILRGHQSDAAEVRRFLDQNYDTPDFAFKFDMKKAESDGRYRREGGPAEAKEKLLSGFKALIKSGKVIDIESGSLKVPAAVAANPKDMACYKTYAQQMFSLHKKVEASLATQDSASFQDADFLLNICQVALQTMELNDQCAKKQLASQTEKPALR